MADEVKKIILEAEIRQSIHDAEEALRQENAALLAAVQSAKALGVAHVAADPGVRAAAASVEVLTRQLKDHNAALARVGGATGQAGQGITQLAFAIDDAKQFSVGLNEGLRALGNNVIGLGLAFGASAGLAGGISIAVSALGLLAPAIEDVYTRFSTGLTSEEAERMTALGAATGKAADEMARLAREERNRKAIEAVATGEPEEVKKTREAATRAILEAGGEGPLIKGLVESRNPQGPTQRLLPQEREKLAGIDAGLAGPDQANFILQAPTGSLIPKLMSKHEYLLQERNKLIAAANNREVVDAKRDVGAALNDPARLKGLVAEIRRTPGAFPKGLADQLAAADPEARALKKADDEALKERAKHAKEEERQREEDSRLAASLTAEGAENERLAREEAEREREKRAAELARNIAPRLDAEQLLGLPVGKDRVRDALTQTQGLSDQEATEVAGAVLAKLQEDLAEALRKKAGEAGIGLDAARVPLAVDRLKALGERPGRGAGAGPDIGGGILGAGAGPGFGGPLSRAMTFSSGVDLQRFADVQALGGNEAGAREETLKALLAEFKAVRENLDPNKARLGGAVFLQGTQE